MAGDDHHRAAEAGYGHRRKFTEGLLDEDLLLRELEIQPGWTVVDAGCGTGYMSRLFSARVGDTGRVYALDLNARFIKDFMAEGPEANITPMVCDLAEGSPLQRASVDLIYLSTVIHAQTRESLKGVIRELKRLLRPGGILAIVEFAKVETNFGPLLKQRYSPEELQASMPFTPLKTVMVAKFFYLQLFRNTPAE